MLDAQFEMIHRMKGHSLPIWALKFFFYNKLLASASEDKQVILWDLSDYSIKSRLTGHTKTVYCLDFSRDG